MVTLMLLWGFIRGASVIIISTITALWLLQGIPVVAGTGGFTHVDDVHDSAYGMLADAAAPVFAPAGFDDWHASAALITGFVAKEVVVGSMSQSYHADGADDTASQQAGEGTLGQKLRASFDQSSHGHGRAAAIAFLLFTLAYTPCLATVAEMRRQFGTKIAARSAESGRGLRHRRNRLPIIAIDMVNGRGRFGIPARGWRRTSRTVGPQDNGQGDIVTRIVGDVAAGLTVRQIAAERHLPVDFVDMAIERARERGSLDVVDMRSRHACGETVCRPDPASLVCVGCPFRFFPSSDS